MNDLISRNALLEQECFMDDDNGFRCSVVLSVDVRRASAVDAVEVVRCKDCKRSFMSGIVCGYECFYCNCHQTEVQPNDFCSYGKRRG